MGESDPDGPSERRGGFMRDFFKELSFSDWIEFLVYVGAAIAVVVVGIGWLVGLF